MASPCGMGQGDSLTLIAANATVAIEFNMLTERVPMVNKSAFTDDRTIDAPELNDIHNAIRQIVDMDTLMGHTTNVDKSKILSTTVAGRKQAAKMEIKGLSLNVVQDFKQLGFTCTGIHRAPTQEAEAAAEEARLRTTRIQYLPLNRDEKKY